VQPDRIGPIRGSRREHSGQGKAQVVSRVHLEHVALCFMKPGQDHDPLPGLDATEAVHERRVDFDTRIRRSLPALSWRIGALFEGGVDAADGMDRRHGYNNSTGPMPNTFSVGVCVNASSCPDGLPAGKRPRRLENGLDT
jgi:hypothetical protein